jgi:hypothetical protein
MVNTRTRSCVVVSLAQQRLTACPNSCELGDRFIWLFGALHPCIMVLMAPVRLNSTSVPQQGAGNVANFKIAPLQSDCLFQQNGVSLLNKVQCYSSDSFSPTSSICYSITRALRSPKYFPSHPTGWAAFVLYFILLDNLWEGTFCNSSLFQCPAII